jgi:3-dehydroquinate dehydratase
MKRRNFIKSSTGATLTGAAVISGLFLNRVFGNPSGAISQIKMPNQFNEVPINGGKSNLFKSSEDSFKDNAKKLSFLNKPYPVITGLIGRETPQELIAAARNSETEGAQGIAISLNDLNPEYWNSESLKSIINSANLPFMFLNYRKGKWGTYSDEDRQELLLKTADLGASMIDVMGDLYDQSPMEITHNQSAIDKQKQLIDKIHKKGADVVISSHMECSRTTEQAVEHMRDLEVRGPDVVKIVTYVNTEEELAEAFKTTLTLKRELKTPFIHLCNGKFGRPHRFICPTLGVSILFAFPFYPEEKGKTIPTIREIKTVLDTINWNIKDVV